MTEDRPGERLLAGITVVLHHPQDLVNVALVLRSMKNMGLRQLRVVEPREAMDPTRLEGIAHGTRDLIDALEVHGSLESALADAAHVTGTTARRRSVRQRWRSPEEAAPDLVRRAAEGQVALVFGPEDRGLSNQELDLCHELLTIPANPEHPSLNLSHAALLHFYELRRAAGELAGVEERDLEPQPRHRAPPASNEELEAFFDTWKRAMTEIGLFYGVDTGPKMRSYRNIFQRADLDRRELKLMEATAYEVLHYARRERARLRQNVAQGGGKEKDSENE